MSQQRGAGPLGDGADAGGVGGAVVDDDRLAEVGRQCGEQPGESLDAILHRHDDRDVGRGRDGHRRFGHRVRDARVEEPAGERRGHRVADLERAVPQPGGRGAGQTQHPGRRTTEQDRAVVHDERLPIEGDPHPVRQRLLHEPSLGRRSTDAGKLVS